MKFFDRRARSPEVLILNEKFCNQNKAYSHNNTQSHIKHCNSDVTVFKRFELSRAKVEKVVKPPQIPTFRNKIRRGFMLLDLRLKAVINPMMKHPRTFMAKVLAGKRYFSLRGINPMRYLKTEPTAPPSATARQSSIFFPCEIYGLSISHRLFHH